MNSGDFEMPLGVPQFPWDFLEEIPAVPAPWNTSTSGFYYVKQGGSASDNGTPAAPRGSIPNLATIPDGSVVVVDNTVNLTGTNMAFNPVGAENAKIWLVGSQQVGLGSGSSQAQLRITGSFDFTSGSQWFIVDGIDFFCNSSNQEGFGASRCQNYVFRNCTIRANGADRAANSSNFVGGSNTSTRAQYGMFYNCVIRDLGLWTHVGGDIDCHGIQIGQWVDDHWFISNEIYHNQGDGIQVTGASNPSSNTPSVVRRLYIGGNTFYENLQTACWHKTGQDIIVSSNTIYGHNSGGGSAPVGCGGQYDFSNVWYLFNRIYDCGNGIRFASSSEGTGNGVIRLIGNVVTGIIASSDVQPGSAFSNGCAFGFWQGSDIRGFFNTVSEYNGHGVACTPGAGNGTIWENNIIQGRTNASCFEVLIESFSTQPKFRNNWFPTSSRFSMSGATTTSVSAFQSASSANRTNNLSSNTTFVSPGEPGDYHVPVGSPAIGSGLLTTDVFTEFFNAYGLDIRFDADGVPRPQDTNYDIGAYERAA